MTDPTPDAPVPTPLSPAAQAVLDAYGHCLGSYEAQVNTTRPEATRLAAALCAIADQVVPERIEPPSGEHESWPQGYKLMFDSKWEQRQQTRAEFLAIATELENH